MEGCGSIATLTKKEATNLLLNPDAFAPAEEIGESEIRQVTGRFNAAVIVKHIGMDLAIFNKINPDFDKKIADEGKYELRLPADKMEHLY